MLALIVIFKQTLLIPLLAQALAGLNAPSKE